MERRVRTLAVALLALVALVGVGLALTGGVAVDGTIPLDSDDSPQIDVVTSNSEMVLDGGHGGAETMEIITEQGTIVFTGPDGTAAHIHEDDIIGQYTTVSQIDGGSGLTINPEDKPPVTVADGIDSVEFGSMAVDDGMRDFSYTASSTASVTVNEIGASSETVIAVASDGTVLDQTTADSSGTATFSSLDSGTYDVTLATTSDPVLTNATPSSGTTVTDTPVELSIEVSDSDFDTTHGDEVTVEFLNADDDSTIGTDTLTSDGTASTEEEDPKGGENNWYVVASDSYGNEVTSDTFTYNTPDVIEVRDEENPSELLTDADVTIEFYQESGDPDTIETVEVTDGTADMTGVAAGESFIAVAQADGYANRRIFIDSLIETQEIYLVNENSDIVYTEFELDDFSGQFNQENSVLVLERNIDNQWTPIQGDFFGSTGRFDATLIRDTRHRMRLINLETGEERRIGTFTPQTDGIQTVTVSIDGSVNVAEEMTQILAQPAIGSISASDEAVFGVDIQEGDLEIESWDIEVMYMNATTTETLANRSGTGPSTEEFILDLSGKRDGSVVANVDYETAEDSGTVILSRSVREHYPGADGLIGGLINVGEGLGAGEDASGASMLASLFISLMLTVGMARVSPSVEAVGIAALGSVAAFGIIGWLPMSVVFAAGVAFGAVMILRRPI